MCTNMEEDGRHRLPANDCPILCVTKIALYVLISLFVLYLPLGEPSTRCAADRAAPRTGAAADWPCQLYSGLLNASHRLGGAADTLVAAARCALHQAKLQFYGLLNKLDKQDLCRVVCFSGAEEECCGASEDEAEGRATAAHCARKHCKLKSARHRLGHKYNL